MLIKEVGFYLLFLVLLTFLTSLINLLGVNSTITNLFLFIFNGIAFFILGFKNGLRSKDKGFLAGIKVGLILLIILFIVNIFLSQKMVSLALLIYYLVLILSSTLGGMLGINKKKEEN